MQFGVILRHYLVFRDKLPYPDATGFFLRGKAMNDFKMTSMPRAIALTALVFCIGFFCGREWETRTPPQDRAGEAPGISDASGPRQDAAAPEPDPVVALSAPTAPVLPAQPVEQQSSDVSEPAPTAPVDVALPGEPAPSASEREPVVAAVSPPSAPEPARAALDPVVAAPPVGSAAHGTSASGATVAPAVSEPSLSRERLPFEPSLSTVALRKLGSGDGPVLLVVGGIQGDEPGGFSAATLLATHYRINAGSVWVVPGLNFRSILERDRGLFGDMNRKFAAIAPDDPELAIVDEIKRIILDDRVAVVLNLHDGSGFYRPAYEDKLRNPKRWGQSLIIDQAHMEAPYCSGLFETAQAVEREVNSRLIDAAHRYHIHNTRTAEGNVQMEKTLSWFAVRNGKPAFGIEASKEFGTDMRAYYHLQVIEAYMRQMGISYERSFDLTPKGVLAALNSNLRVAAYDNRLVLDLENVRPNLAMVPFKKGCEPDQRTSKPLLALVPETRDGNWRVAYGNRTLTRLSPEFMDFDESLNGVEMLVDGKSRSVRFGEIVDVRDSFLVKGVDGYRVNAIGAKKEVNGTEADVTIVRRDFLPRYSVDKGATTYRVEVYKDKAFAGMLLVRFGGGGIAEDVPLTATTGPESDLGF